MRNAEFFCVDGQLAKPAKQKTEIGGGKSGNSAAQEKELPSG
jgi:hypothetical protein